MVQNELDNYACCILLSHWLIEKNKVKNNLVASKLLFPFLPFCSPSFLQVTAIIKPLRLEKS